MRFNKHNLSPILFLFPILCLSIFGPRASEKSAVSEGSKNKSSQATLGGFQGVKWGVSQKTVRAQRKHLVEEDGPFLIYKETLSGYSCSKDFAFPLGKFRQGGYVCTFKSEENPNFVVFAQTMYDALNQKYGPPQEETILYRKTRKTVKQKFSGLLTGTRERPAWLVARWNFTDGFLTLSAGTDLIQYWRMEKQNAEPEFRVSVIYEHKDAKKEFDKRSKQFGKKQIEELKGKL